MTVVELPTMMERTKDDDSWGAIASAVTAAVGSASVNPGDVSSDATPN